MKSLKYILAGTGIILAGLAVLVLVGHVVHMFWMLVGCVVVVGIIALAHLFVGGNNPRQNAAAYARLPSDDKLAEIVSQYPPSDDPPWA